MHCFRHIFNLYQSAIKHGNVNSAGLLYKMLKLYDIHYFGFYVQIFLGIACQLDGSAIQCVLVQKNAAVIGVIFQYWYSCFRVLNLSSIIEVQL